MPTRLADDEPRATNSIPVVGRNGERTTVHAPANGNRKPSTPESGSEPDDWFFIAAHGLLGDKDTGLLLHYLTGYPQSSCYAYVTKEADKRRKPPDHLVRKLIHSDAGEPWHRAFMEGCRASWWLAFQEDRRVAARGIEFANDVLNVRGTHGNDAGMQDGR